MENRIVDCVNTQKEMENRIVDWANTQKEMENRIVDCVNTKKERLSDLKITLPYGNRLASS